MLFFFSSIKRDSKLGAITYLLKHSDKQSNGTKTTQVIQEGDYYLLLYYLLYTSRAGRQFTLHCNTKNGSNEIQV